jgi:hypothetical protein
MSHFVFLLCLPFLLQLPPDTAATGTAPLEKSRYFAFLDQDYIFTIEVVKPGVPLLNFVAMADQDISLAAKNVRLTLENRKTAGRFFAVETGDYSKQPMVVPSLTIHPRSSFGVRLEGDFEGTQELLGVTIRLGSEDLKLVPLSKPDFELFVMKVNRLNLGSPDFSDDRRVLQLKFMGTRTPARGR